MTAPRILVGTDLVAVEAVAAALRDFGPRYTSRIFTAGEAETCLATPATAAQRLAARFAAKEATFKILRPPGGWLDPREIEVCRAEDGAPGLVLHGEAAAVADAAGLEGWSVSLSHETSFATAVVLAVRGHPIARGPDRTD